MSLLKKYLGVSRFALLGALALGLMLPATAAANEEEDTSRAETLVVVGSRIPTSTPLDGAAPVQIVDAERISNSGGLVNLGDLLQELPGAGSAVNLLYNNGGDGSVRLDFRELGPQRTLMLVDGRRWVPGGEGANGSSDINTIPLGLVERIEILKDGASSVYGSDAMGAVVNIVTKKEFDGARFEYLVGGYEDGGGERKRAEALFGIDGERGNVTLGMTWVNSYPLGNHEREQTAARPLGGGSSGTPQARLVYDIRLDAAGNDADDFRNNFVTGNTAGTAVQAERNAEHDGWATSTKALTNYTSLNPQAMDDVPTTLTEYTLGTSTAPTDNSVSAVPVRIFCCNFTVQEGAASSLRGADPTDFRVWEGGNSGDGFNFNPYNYVLTPNERRSIFLNSRFDLTDRVSVTAKVVYQNRRSDQLLAPAPLFWSGAGEGISANNAFNSLGVEFCGGGVNLAGESCYGNADDMYYYYDGSNNRLPDYYENGEAHSNLDYGNDDNGDPIEALDVNLDYSGDMYTDSTHDDYEVSIHAGRAYTNAYANGTATDASGILYYTGPAYTTNTAGNVVLDDTMKDPVLYYGAGGSGTEGDVVPDDTDWVSTLVQRLDDDGSTQLFEGISGANVLKEGHADGWFGRRMLENGTRNFIQDIETFHAQIGMEGEFDMGAGTWIWDVQYSWSQNQASIRTEGLINTNRLRNALGASVENSAYVAAADLNNDRQVGAGEATAYNAANSNIAADTNGDETVSAMEAMAWNDDNFTSAADLNGDGMVSATEATTYNTDNSLSGGNAIVAHNSISAYIEAAQRFELDDNGNVACVTDADNGCVSLNLFGGQGTDSTYLGDGLWAGSGSMTPQMLNYISFLAQDTGGNTQKLLTASMAGDVVQLPAGPLGLAVGYEFRKLTGFDQPDALIATDQTSGNVRTPTKGEYDVTEYYMEVKVPLVGGIPGIQDLELSASVRSSDYSTFGSATTDKISIRWEFTDKIIFRASTSTGHRAPGIGELFQGQSDSYPQVSDPCAATLQSGENGSFVGADNFAICEDDGVETDFDQPNSQIRITVGGNPDLQPENSLTETWGFVFKPTDAMEIYLDVWSIEITDAITDLGAQTILDRCYDPTNQGHSLLYCDLIDRTGNSISDLRSFALNLAALETEGADIAFVYDPNDSWRILFDATYVQHNTTINSLGDRSNFIGTAGTREATPRVKARLYARWSNENWTVSMEENYIHGVISAVSGQGNRYLAARGYMDVQATYYYEPWKTSVTLSIDNLLDQDPPFHPGAFANDFNADYRFWSSRSWTLRFITSF